MNKEELSIENINLKITVRILSEQIAAQQQEISELKNKLEQASLPRPKITPSAIELNETNLDKLAHGLKGIIAPTAGRRKFLSVARQIITLHNNAGIVSNRELLKASGLSYDGFIRQSMTVRKAGLLIRLPQKRFQLSDKSKEILNTVFG